MTKEITVTEFKDLLDNKADIAIIDVREPHEHEDANLGGLLMPLNTVAQNVAIIPKDKQVVIYCRSGSRSGNAIRFLESNFGFTNLYNLKGGILAWKNEIDDSLEVY